MSSGEEVSQHLKRYVNDEGMLNVEALHSLRKLMESSEWRLVVALLNSFIERDTRNLLNNVVALDTPGADAVLILLKESMLKGTIRAMQLMRDMPAYYLKYADDLREMQEAQDQTPGEKPQ